MVNFDPPGSIQGYVHRVGRTGRAGQRGLALSILTPGKWGGGGKGGGTEGRGKRGGGG